MPYSTEQTFAYSDADESLGLIVKANGGSLVIGAYDGAEYITADTINADLVTEYYVKGMSLKFTPSGGCTFVIREAT